MILAFSLPAPKGFSQGTAFSLQGRLNTNSVPATGTYDLRLSAYDATNSGNLIAGPITILGVNVANGVFSTSADFGGSVFTGPARFLEMAFASSGSGTFLTTPQRQQVLASPYSIFAGVAKAVASGSAVKSFNGLTDSVTLQGANGITVTPTGNTLTIGYNGTSPSQFWNPTTDNSIYYSGHNVGIGVTYPSNRVTVGTLSTSYGIEHTDGRIRLATYVGNGLLDTEGAGLGTLSNHRLDFFVNAGGPSMSLDTRGNVGIGTTLPVSDAKLTIQSHVNSIGTVFPHYGLEHTDGTVELSSILDGTGAWLGTRSNHPLNLYVNDGYSFGTSSLTIDATGNVGIGTDSPQTKLDVRGITRTCALTITGGCDLAEPFAVDGSEIPAGSVMIIDENHTGGLKLSQQAYDTRVAGIISGAQGINAGITLRQAGTFDSGPSVALSGRVYARADASYGAIKPGDLLTTSNTPGHAMKVSDHAKAAGAILGKAMSSLGQGKGLVLVLVTLQ